MIEPGRRELLVRAMHALAERIEREATAEGELDPIEQPLASIVADGDLVLEFGSLLPPDPHRYLEVRLERSGRKDRSEDIRGTNARIVAGLRDPRTVDTILEVAARLATTSDD